MTNEMTVEFTPCSPAFSTFMDLVERVVSPKQLLKLFSYIDPSKFNPKEKEAVKKMAIDSIIELQANLEDLETVKLFTKYNIEIEHFQDSDYNLNSIVSDSDLEVFD